MGEKGKKRAREAGQGRGGDGEGHRKSKDHRKEEKTAMDGDLEEGEDIQVTARGAGRCNAIGGWAGCLLGCRGPR